MEALVAWNEAYWELLRRVKSAAKARRDNCAQAQAVCRAIKANYASFDTGNAAARAAFEERFGDATRAWLQRSTDRAAALAALPALADVDAQLYNGIPARAVRAVLSDDDALVDAWTKLGQRLTDDDAQPSTDPLSGLKDTALGQLMSDVMADVNLDELRSGLPEDGNVFAALADGSSPVAKLMGNVSQRMMAKLASGELNQDQLLQDALSFVGRMQGSLPPGFADIGGLLGTLTGAGGSGGGAGNSPSASTSTSHSAHNARARMRARLASRQQKAKGSRK